MSTNVNAKMRAGMREATRLTKAGNLHEATAAIQRALRGTPAPTAAAPNAAADTRNAPIDSTCRVIEADVLPPPSDAAMKQAQQARRPAPPAGVRTPSSRQRRAYIKPVTRPAPAPERARDVDSGARFIARSYSNHAGTRAYKLYIPSHYRGQALPLIVMLHGCTQDPDDFAAGTCMNALAEEHCCFVAYPAQSSAANPTKCWNWFKASDQQRNQGEPSLIAGITQEIISDYSIDPRRVYVAGLSAGGAMAAVMGMTYPDLYAAIGIHSGLPYAAASDLPSAFMAMNQCGIPMGSPADKCVAPTERSRVVPAIVFHGDRDTTVHPRNGDQVIAQWATLHASDKAKAATKLRVTVHEGQAPHGHAYTRAIYQDANSQALLEQWRIHGAGHAWSGGSSSGSFTDPKGPDATREMVRFFYDHARD